MGADQPGPLRDLPQDRLASAILDVLVGERGLPLGPRLDALDERAGLVVARLPDGQDRVEVDMRVDERRGEEAAVRVEDAAVIGRDRAGRPDLGDRVAVGPNVDERDVAARGRMDARVADEQSCRGSLRRAILRRADGRRCSILGRSAGVLTMLRVDATDMDALVPRDPAVPTDPRLDGVLAELHRREPIFHRLELGTTRADFEAHTAPGFWEVGASGRVYSREVVWDTLAERYADPGYAAGDDWATSDFACREIAPETYLLTYLLRQGERVTRRLTVWQGAPGRWVILYHQGTVVGEP
jgi:hypothetical protein